MTDLNTSSNTSKEIPLYLMNLMYFNLIFVFCILVDGSVEGRKLYQNGARRTASGRGKF